MKMYSTRIFLAASFLLFLSGCGDSGGDSPVNQLLPGNDPGTPAAPETPVVPGTPTVPVTPTAPVTPPAPVVPEPPAGPGTSGPLSQLFGDVGFFFEFTGQPNAFLLATQFGTDTIVSNGTNPDALINDAVFAVDTDGTGFTADTEQVSVVCSYIDNVGSFLCSGSISEANTALFLFADIVAGESNGNFSNCASDETTETCASDLANAPDGPVRVSVTQPTINAIASIVDIDLENRSNVAEAYFGYSLQGTGNTSKTDNTGNEELIEIIDAMRGRQAAALK